MAIDLADYAPSLRREVTPLGTTMFAAVTDNDLTAYLTDAFWEARLDGFLTGYAADEDGVVTPTSGSTDLSLAGVALVVMYAGIRVMRTQILNMGTDFRAKAGPVEFEKQNSAIMLREMLKQLYDRRTLLIERSLAMTDVHLVDAYSTRMLNSGSYYGAPELTAGGIDDGRPVRW
jgi:hypothetical protein